MPATLRKPAAALIIAGCTIAALTASVRAESVRASRLATKSVWDSVYTTAQAARGDSLYKTSCAKCHGDTLTGPPPGAPDDGAPLVGADFLANWSGLTVGDLYEKVRDYMPTDKPKSLDGQLIADVIAFVLSKNNFPAGGTALPNDVPALKDIKIERTKP
jgi:mono/diheme cytochrome c family protein